MTVFLTQTELKNTTALPNGVYDTQVRDSILYNLMLEQARNADETARLNIQTALLLCEFKELNAALKSTNELLKEATA